jgi:gluconate 2-dehydrogenase gamma chain
MTRRDANWLLLRAAAASGGAEFFGAWCVAATHAGNHSAPPDPHNWAAYQPKFFSAADLQILDAYTAILIPTDETPGAREAQVVPFIDFVVNAAADYAPEVQSHWRSALEWLHTQRFAQLSPDEQAAVVSQMPSSPDNSHIYQLIKDMTVQAFYTSRVGLIEVLEYQGIAYLSEFPGCTHADHRIV